MIDPRCIGPGVNAANLSPDATVDGSSWLTGPATRVGTGAVVRNSHLHDAEVDAGARVLDSIVVAEGSPHQHRCDPAGRTVVGGAAPSVAAGARLAGATLINCAVGERTHITDTWAENVTFGADNRIRSAKLVLTTTRDRVAVEGPTEVSEALLGESTRLDRRGYFEGVFSNAFRRLELDEATGRLRVAEVIDLPHVSLYGLNAIHSTNSGKLLPQPDGRLAGVGRHVGLWRDPLLSHEPIELGPCCWVAPWTKVIGQSATPHADADSLVNDDLATVLMPFSLSGHGGELTRGTVMPGELSVGLGTKQRRGAWVFTYAPDLVIRMVQRLWTALPRERRQVADTIVEAALDTALAMTAALARRHGVDLGVAPAKQRHGWPRWIADTWALLRVHRDTDLWRFEDGQPIGWFIEGGQGNVPGFRYRHPSIGRLLNVAPDAYECQVSEADIFAAPDPHPIRPLRVAMAAGDDAPAPAAPVIDPTAQVDPGAVIGPGSRIGPRCIIAAGAVVWDSDLDHATVRAGARVLRSVVGDSLVEAGGVVRASRLHRSTVGAGSRVDAAVAGNAWLAARSTLSALAEVRNVQAACATIVGGRFEGAEVGGYLMSMHLAGCCEHLRSLPTPVAVGGRVVLVPAVPMLGGGSQVLGAANAPVRMEACFVGSNAIVRAGCHIGFGCFLLGELQAGAGLPPFTFTPPGGGLERHRVGGVLESLASTIITHFVGWTFQATGPDLAPAVAGMVLSAVRRGLAAVEAEIARRNGRNAARPAEFASLARYTDQQLADGRDAYRRAIDSGAWEMAFDASTGELRFTSGRGVWEERGGGAFWRESGSL
ncbi:MAG: hypothetical protein BIFFINMI_01663 [Phycisphaerae bacterium]|nr:hypothetical protein [Phycisphaerae bacterium]